MYSAMEEFLQKIRCLSTAFQSFSKFILKYNVQIY